MDEFNQAAVRMAGEHNLHSAAFQRGKWLAVRLSDGGNDGVCYDTRHDAVAHQLWPEYRFYLQVQPGPIRADEAADCIDFARKAFSAGLRVTDPEVPDAIMPLEYKR